MTKVTIKSLFLKYKFYLIAIVLFSFVANGLNLYVPKLVGETIDKLISKQTGDNNIVITLSIIIFASLAFSLIELVFSTWFSEKFAQDLRVSAFSNLVKQPYQYVIQEGSAKIITIFGSDVDNIQENFTNSLSYLFQALVLFIGAAYLMFSVSWKLTIIAILTLPLISLVFSNIFARIGKLFGQSQINLTDLNNIATETTSSSTLVRVLSAFKWEQAKYTNANTQSKDISIKIVKGFSLMIPITTFITNIATIAFIYFGGRLYESNELTVGQLTAFIGYFSLLITPIFILGFTSQGISQALASWKRVEPVINANEQKVDGIHTAKQLLGQYELKNVTLEYLGKKVLDNISLTIPAGQKTALLGPTGAGKSQLLNLLIGLNQPTSGEILLDGVNLVDWNKDDLLSKVGIVFQDSLIFDGTLHNNITMGRDVNNEQINKAIDTAELSSFTSSMSDNVETMLQEKGSNLSGGQKQRVTLARALVTNPDLLLLDDFTARVDKATENSIQSKIANNYPKTSIVQVCQKIETIQNYDNIIVLMEGQLVGQGTHQFLLDTSNEYQQIYKSQQLV
jgi:ATP-binding cassette, subfamily B, bacterial